MKIDYKCKFCFRPGTIDCDVPEYFTLDYWKSILACNRCADFMVEKRRYVDLIRKTSLRITNARVLKSKNLSEVEKEVRADLDSLSKLLCTCVNRHYGLDNIWDSSLTDVLMEQPQHSEMSCENYVRRKKKESQRITPALPYKDSEADVLVL